MSSTINASTASGGGLVTSADASGILQLQTAGVTALTIDGSQNVGIGTSSPTPTNASAVVPKLVVTGSGATGIQAIRTITPGGGGAQIIASTTRGTDANSYTALQLNDGIGTLSFNGTDGTRFIPAATVMAQVDGVVSTNNVLGRLVFGTSAGGANSVIERMRIDSSGNVGIGTSSPSKTLDVNGTIGYTAQNVTTQTNYFNIGAVGSIGNATGSKMTFRRNYDNIELVTINGDGNVGIGVTPNTNFGAKLQLGSYQGIGASAVSQNLGYYPVGGVYNWRYPLGTTGWLSGSIAIAGGSAYYFQIFGAPACAGAVDSIVSSQGSLYYIDSSFNHVWQRSGSAESMRIDASGNLLVGTTAQLIAPSKLAVRADTGSFGQIIQCSISGGAAFAINNTGASYLQYFYNNGSVVGSITNNTTNTFYNTSSDKRLKTNIKPAGSAIQSILNFPVDQFDWISDSSHQDFGGVAQKILKVIPEMVSVPENHEEMMGVDWSKAVPRLIKTIQELKAIIDTQNARIEALEAK